MSLNSYVLNGGVVNGTRTASVFAQTVTATSSTSTSTLARSALAVRAVTSISAATKIARASKALSYLSTSIATAIKAVVHATATIVSTSTSTLAPLRRLVRTLTSTSTSAFSVIKQVLAIRITLGNKYLITGGLGAIALDVLAINADLPVYTTTTGVGSTATVYPGSVFKRTITATQASVVTILTALNKLVTLTFASTSVAKILKAITNSPLVSSATSAGSIIKKFVTTLVPWGTKYVITGGVGSAALGSLALNADNPVYVTAPYISSTATVTTPTVFKWILTLVQVTTAAIGTAISRLKTITFSSTSLAVALKQAQHFIQAPPSTSAGAVVKIAQPTLIVYGTKYVITGGVGSSPLGGLALNADNPVYVSTPGIGSTATVSTPTIFKLIITLVQISVSAIGTILNKGVILTAVNTSIAVISKMVQPSFWLTGATGTSTAIKQAQPILTTYGTKYVITGGIGSNVLDSLALNADNPAYTTTPYVGATATMTPRTVYKFLITLVNVSVAAIGTAVTRLQSVVGLSTSLTTIFKMVQPSAWGITSTSLGTVPKKVGVVRATSGVSYVISGGIGSTMLNSLAVNSDSPVYTTLPNVQSTATISPKSVFIRIIAFANITVAAVGTAITRVASLSASVTSNTTIFKLVSKLFLFGSTCIAYLAAVFSGGGTLYFAALTVTSYTTTALTYVISRFVVALSAAAKDTIIVPTYRTLVALTNGIVSILVRPSKTVVTSTEEDNLDG